MSSLEKIFSLKNYYVLITGAAGLLGQKHAEAIAFAGGIPILTDIKTDLLHKIAENIYSDTSLKPLVYEMNVTVEESVLYVLNDLKKHNIFVDVLINNAARNPAVDKQGLKNNNRIESYDFSLWDKDIAVGLTGAVICSKIFGTDMSERKKGNIVNVASDLGIIAPDQRLYMKENIVDTEQDVKPVSYSVVKHGLIGLTKYLATYWADKNVRCNAISPGGVYNQQPDSFLEKINTRIPLGRMAHIDEYQGAIIFLCSQASSYMNGANLVIDGGRSVW